MYYPAIKKIQDPVKRKRVVSGIKSLKAALRHPQTGVPSKTIADSLLIAT